MERMEADMESFDKDLEEFQICLNQNQRKQFLDYFDLLVKWNSFMNLTAITEFQDVLKKHFVDSVSLVRAVPELGSRPFSVIDVGTGAGFPGIPLKIVFPDLKVTLLDSLNKRTQFLNEVIHSLKLKDIIAIHGRAEDFAREGQLRESFDLCVSRAVANLSVLSEYCIPFVKKGGYFVSYKSEHIDEEIKNAEKAVQILGGMCESKIEFELPDSDINRTLIRIKKTKSTPLKYPRKAGVPSREPIGQK